MSWLLLCSCLLMSLFHHYMAHGSTPVIHMIMILFLCNNRGKNSTKSDHKFIEANFKLFIACYLPFFRFCFLHIPFRSWGPFWSHQPFKLQCTDAFLMCMPLWTNLSMQNKHFCNSNKKMECVYFAYSVLSYCKLSSAVASFFSSFL